MQRVHEEGLSLSPRRSRVRPEPTTLRTGSGDVRFDAATTAALHPSIKHGSFGAALQTGVDVPVVDGWLLNADAKKVQIATDVSSSGSKVGTFKVDPWLFSLGVGRRF